MDIGLVIESLVLIAFSIVGMWEAIGLLRRGHFTGDIIGPGGYLAFVFLALCVTTIIYSWRNYKKADGAVRMRWISLRFGPAARLLVILGLYHVAVPIVGYAVGSILFFIPAFKISGVKSWIWSIVLGLAVGLIFELMFVRVARIPFP